jgi:DivIVA domain-containing protein
MPESERRQRVISSTPRLSPEDVANRSFGSTFRGFAEPEVRAFLRRVAEELTTARDREAELLQTLDGLEEQLRTPRPLDEQELLDALGEETARLLRTAREASDDIRRKAEERSANVMEDAQREAHRLRTEAAEILGVRTQEAEAAASDIVGEAEARAAEVRAATERADADQRTRAEQEAAAIVEDARHRGREMLDEARVARERVLADLGRRRALLQAQVEELRQGRDRLLEAYRVVKRTFLDATEALAHVEARAAAERAHAPSEPVPGGIFVETATVEVEVVTPGATDADDSAAGAALADVDSLFARIRAGQAEAVADEPADVPPITGLDAAESGSAADDAGEASDEEPAAEAEPTPDQPSPEESAPDPISREEDIAAPSAVDSWRTLHSSTADPLLPPLVKRAKRVAQDEQNALLDAVRRHKGRPSSEQVLGEDDAAVRSWSDVLHDALETAYNAGRDAAGGDSVPVPDDVVREHAASVVLPLRERVAVAIDDGDAGDTGGLVERIGARYREWKNQQLERLLGDVVVASWSRGVYDAAADGTTLQWVPLVEGRCADCDDNALEPTVKGETFPTGQAHPPAHPGCRCLLAPTAALG